MGGSISKVPKRIPINNNQISKNKFGDSIIGSSSSNPKPKPPSNDHKSSEGFERFQNFKSPEVERDGIDPEFGSMLKKLGQVKVPKLSTTFSPERDNMLKILESRSKSSTEINNSSSSSSDDRSSNKEDRSILSPDKSFRNDRLSLDQISSLLDHNKIRPLSFSKSTSSSLTTTAKTTTTTIGKNETSTKVDEILKVCESIDHKDLNLLLKHYNSVSIKNFKNPDPGVEEPLKVAVWVSQSKKNILEL